MIIVNIFVLEVLLKGKNCVDFFVGMDILVYMEWSIVMFGWFVILYRVFRGIKELEEVLLKRYF